MANSNGNDWDETSPALNQARRLGAAEIANLRKAVRQRLLKEHVEPDTANEGGEHKAGSAMCFIGNTEPTVRPDGTTPLDADDKGRLWYYEAGGRVRIWNGSAWIENNIPTSGFFQKDNASPFSLPFTQTGLGSGTWHLTVCGLVVPNGTLSMPYHFTVNGTTRGITLLNNPDRPFQFCLHALLVVSGGSISVTAATNCTVHTMTGVRVGWP